MSARRSNVHMVMEKNSQILRSQTSRELTESYLQVLDSGVGTVEKAGPFIYLLGGSLLVAGSIAGNAVYS